MGVGRFGQRWGSVAAAIKIRVKSWEEGDCGFGKERVKSRNLYKK